MSYLTDKDVASGTKGLCGRCAQRAAHDKGNLADDGLHDAHIVQHGDHAAEEDYHWQHLQNMRCKS